MNKPPMMLALAGCLPLPFVRERFLERVLTPRARRRSAAPRAERVAASPAAGGRKCWRTGVWMPLLPAVLVGSACAVPGGAAGQDGTDPELSPISPNRPTFSDGTGLVPVGHTQVETGYTLTSRSQGGTDTERSNVPEVIGRYRISEAIEARVIWNGYAWSETDQGAAGSSSVDGGTDAAVAVLVPVVQQDGWVPAITLEALTTLGVGSESFSSGHADPAMKLLWSYGGGHLPDWFGVGGNLIAAYPTENGDRFTQTAASLWATYSAVGSDTCLFAEWFVVSEPANNVKSTQSVDFGVVQRLCNTVAVDARAGFGLDDRADDFFTGVGISFLF